MEKIKTLEEYNTFTTENNDCIVKVGAAWCGPCRVLEKTLHDIESEQAAIKIAEIDADDCDEELMTKLGVRNIPVMFIKHNVGEAERVVGIRTKDQILNIFNNGKEN
jgi:thioredoxin 1